MGRRQPASWRLATPRLRQPLPRLNPTGPNTRHEHHDHQTYPRKQAGAGGPVGSSTDRGKLVPSLRKAADPPVSVVTPDLRKLPYTMKGKVKEFHLVAQHTR